MLVEVVFSSPTYTLPDKETLETRQTGKQEHGNGMTELIILQSSEL